MKQNLFSKEFPSEELQKQLEQRERKRSKKKKRSMKVSGKSVFKIKKLLERP